jgi:hypothetical protein
MMIKRIFLYTFLLLLGIIVLWLGFYFIAYNSLKFERLEGINDVTVGNVTLKLDAEYISQQRDHDYSSLLILKFAWPSMKSIPTSSKAGSNITVTLKKNSNPTSMEYILEKRRVHALGEPLNSIYPDLLELPMKNKKATNNIRTSLFFSSLETHPLVFSCTGIKNTTFLNCRTNQASLSDTVTLSFTYDAKLLHQWQLIDQRVHRFISESTISNSSLRD